MRPLWTVLMIALPLAIVAPQAGAQSPDDGTRAAARALALEGDAAWDKGDFATARDRFMRAFELVKALPLAVREAECLLKMGKLVEASERYTFVANSPVTKGMQQVVKDAIKTAQKELKSLRPRIPMLELVVEGEPTEGTKVLVDGKEVPRALWGVKMPVNPGKHSIEAQGADQQGSVELALEEGESKRQVLRLEPKAQPKPAAASATQKPVVAQPPVATSSSATKTWGWIGLGVGGAGLAFGAVTGVMALSKQKSLDDAGCTDGRCPAGTSGDVDSYNGLRTLSTVGFGVGLAGVAVGAVLLATAPSEKKAGMHGWIGPGSAGLAGTF